MITLGVDQATVSGWSLRLDQRPIASGTLDVWSWEARRDVLRQAFALANSGKLDAWLKPTWFLFAFEDHAGSPLRSYRSTAQVLALGSARGLWLDSLNRMGHPESLRVGIATRAWRSAVLGLKASLKRDACKEQAVSWAEDHTGKRGLSDDEAEAICVSAWGARYGAEELRKKTG